MEKIDYLIKYLLKENQNIKIEEIPINAIEKKNFYRSLCNIRDIKSVSKKFLQIQDEYLQEELNTKGIVDDLEEFKIESKIYLWLGDITKLKVEAIVNAANSKGLGCFIPCHKCIDNCIHSSSGVQLRIECKDKMKKIHVLETGNAFITKAYNLPSKYVIHTVGPIIYENVTKKHIEELKQCYVSSLKIAEEKGIKEIVFPCISTGEFRFPKQQASHIAIKAVKEYLKEKNNIFQKIIFNVFSEEDYWIYKNEFGKEDK